VRGEERRGELQYTNKVSVDKEYISCRQKAKYVETDHRYG
jgi:hypothetical protein